LSRVVIVVHNLPVPYDRRVWLEATTLARAGYEVSVVCPATDDFPAKFERLEDVDIHRFALPLGETPARLAVEFAVGFVQVTLKLAKLRARGRIDVLHVCNPPEIYWPLAYPLRALGTRFLFDHHDLAPEMYRAKFRKGNDLVHRILLFLERRTYAAADAALVTNESYRRIATGRTKMSTESVTTVRSGPSVERFAVMSQDLTVRKGAEHLLVFLGEVGEQDGVEALVEASAELLRRGIDVHTLVIGDGPGKAAVEDLAAELGVANTFSFVGRVSDDAELSRLLSSADVGVVPDPNTDWSRHSTMNKVMEYMFFGLAIAAFDLIETRVSAEEAAIYATPDDTSSLADAIQTLLLDPQERSRRGEFGRQRLHQSLSWEHSAPELLSVYAELTRQNSAGSVS